MATDYSNEEWMFLYTAWRRYSSEISFWEYCYKHFFFKLVSSHRYMVILPKQEQSYLKNPGLQAKSGIKHGMKMVWRGTEFIEQAKRKGRGILLVGWHHGAHLLGEFAVVDHYPEIVRFGDRLIPSGTNININILENVFKGTFLLSQKFLNREPVYTYFDGGGGGGQMECELFGKKQRISRGLFSLILRYRPCVLPFTAYVDSNYNLNLSIGSSEFAEKIDQSGKEEEVLSLIVKYFENHLVETAPWAVNPRAISDQNRLLPLKTDQKKKAQT